MIKLLPSEIARLVLSKYITLITRHKNKFIIYKFKIRLFRGRKIF